MESWKTVGVAVFGAGVLAFGGLSAAALRGQEPRPDREARVARAMSAMSFTRGQIGVSVRDVRPADVSRQGGRVAVEQVTEGSPAARAGVQAGDVVLEFDGERVRSTRHFSRLVDETPDGYPVQMTVSRDGRPVTVEVTPERQSAFRVTPLERWHMPRPEGAPAPPALREFELELPDIEVFTSRRSVLGVQVQGLTEQLAAHLGVKHGVLVTSVESDSPASRAGLKAGDVITSVNGMTVEDQSDLRRRLRRLEGETEFALEITRDRTPLTLKGTLPGAKRERF